MKLILQLKRIIKISYIIRNNILFYFNKLVDISNNKTKKDKKRLIEYT